MKWLWSIMFRNEGRDARLPAYVLEDMLMIDFHGLLNGWPKDMRQFIQAQYLWETNDGRSSIYQENNNLFGLKEPSIRDTEAIGTNRGHAVFINKNASIVDLKKWMQYWFNTNGFQDLLNNVGAAEYIAEILVGNFRKVDSLDVYKELLAFAPYAEDPNYIQNVDNYKTSVGHVNVLWVIVIGVVLLYLFARLLSM